jgi:site-specific recombinase XerD
MEREIEQFKCYLERRFPKRRTAIDYVGDVRQFTAYCGKPWREVTVHDIDGFVDAQRDRLKPSTVKRRVAALKTFFDFLAEESDDLHWANPVRFRRHAGRPGQRLPRDLSDEAVGRLWAQITSPRDRAWFALMLRGGLRVGEVIVLQRGDVLSVASAQEPARLRVRGKGQKERIVLLCAEAYNLLEEWLRARPGGVETYIFVNERGQPLTANGIEWLLRGYAQRAQLRVTPHQLRHTYARQVTEVGMPISSLSKLLGHSQISTTQIYTAGADPGLRQAYQAAMTELGTAAAVQAPVPAPAVPAAERPPAPPSTVPPLPDWSSWMPDLPPGLREPTLAYVRHVVEGYRPHRRRHCAMETLGEFRRFWHWQKLRRPIVSLEQLTLRDLQAYQEQRCAQKVAPTTINHSLKYVLALLRHYSEQGEVVDSSVFRVRLLPRGDRLPRALSADEVVRIEQRLDQLSADSSDPLTCLHRACYYVLAHGGLRARECVDLQCEDLDLAKQCLIVRQGKGQKDRVVYLSQTACGAVQSYLDSRAYAPQGPLWLRPGGQPITYAWLWLTVRQLAEAAEVSHVSPHRLRHTLATRLLNAGLDITRIQKLLGHLHINTTMIYARLSDATLESDYRRAMTNIEAHRAALSDAPVLVENWPQSSAPSTSVAHPSGLDNSV